MSGLTYEEMCTWRVEIANLIKQMSDKHGHSIEIINPVDYYNFEEKRHQNEKEVMQYDLNHVKTSDIIIVKLSGINSSIGTCIELYVAYTRNIPVIAIDLNNDYKNVHPWIKECITRVENSYEEVVEYIKDFYLI